MKFIGQYIQSLIARFRADVYLENISTSSETGVLVVDSDGKITKNTSISGGGASSLSDGSTSTGDTFTFTSANTTDPLFTIKNTTNDANGARLRFVKDKGAAGADNDVAGQIEFYADDDNQDNILFAQIIAQVKDASNNAEEGKLTLSVASHDGEMQAGLILQSGNSEDEVDVFLGHTTSSLTQVNGGLGVSGEVDVGTTCLYKV